MNLNKLNKTVKI